MRLRFPLLFTSILAFVMAPLAGGSAPAQAVVSCPTAAANYAGGAGTAQAPYLISTGAELQKLRDDSQSWGATAYYALTADIDMGGCAWSNGIGNLVGQLDGRSHVVTGLDIIGTGGGNFGFVRNLRFDGSTAGRLVNIGFTGDVTVSSSASQSGTVSLGGLVGYMEGFAVISNSFATGDVSGSVTVAPGQMMNFWMGSAYANIGGLVGGASQNAGDSIVDSYATGSVYASSAVTAGGGAGSYNSIARAGGLIGYSRATIERSWAAGAVSANAAMATGTPVVLAGGLVGEVQQGSTTQSVWNTSTTGQSAAFGSGSAPVSSVGKTTVQMQDLGTYTAAPIAWTNIAAGFDAAKTWGICTGVNGGYPFLTSYYTSDPCIQPPTIATVAPASGSTLGGTSVVITGTQLTGATGVSFGGTAAASFTVDSALQITAVSPAHAAGAADVAVTTAGGTATSSGAFTFQAPSVQSGGSGTAPTQLPTTESSVATSSQSPAVSDYPAIVPAPVTSPPAAGQATASTNGRPVATTVTNTSSGAGTTTTVVVGDSGVSYSITAPVTSAATTLTTSAPIPLRVRGARPLSTVTVFAQSEPVLVATAVADEQGEVSGLITLPASLPAGHHTLVVSAYDVNGSPLSSYLGVNVQVPTAQATRRIEFAYESVRLTKTMQSRLLSLINASREHEPTTVTVGYIRASGASQRDVALARARARVVAAFLKHHGMPGRVSVGASIPTRLTTAAARSALVSVTYS